MVADENKRLLLDPEEWTEIVNAFEAKIGNFPNIEKQESERSRYLISFDNCEFAQSANSFRNLTFPCSVSFRNTKFEGYTSFVGSVFLEDASFNDSKFSGQAQFGGAKFKKHALFHKSETSSVFLMKRLKVGGNLDLSGSKISRYLELSFTEIGGDLNLGRMHLNDASINVSGAKVGGSFIANAEYPRHADFSQMQVNGSTTFAGSVFKRAPDFRDAKFASPFELSKMEIPSPNLPNRTCWRLGLASDHEDEAKFRKLKVMAMEMHDHEREGRFLAEEFMAKRISGEWYSPNLFVNWLYWILSYYGQSFMRPLVGLGVSLVLFTCMYLLIAFYGVETYMPLPNWDELRLAVGMSIRNFIPIIGSLFGALLRPEDHSSSFMTVYHDLVHKGLDADWLIAIGIVQNIIGAVLLFLFLLALRNKFRLK